MTKELESNYILNSEDLEPTELRFECDSYWLGKKGEAEITYNDQLFVEDMDKLTFIIKGEKHVFVRTEDQ